MNQAPPRKPGTILGFAALFVALATTWLWFRAARLVEIPENRIVFIAFWVAAIGLGVATFVRRTRWFGAIPAVLGAAIGAFLLFTIGISRQEVGTTGIQVGQTIPAFQAVDRNGAMSAPDRALCRNDSMVFSCALVLTCLLRLLPPPRWPQLSTWWSW